MNLTHKFEARAVKLVDMITEGESEILLKGLRIGEILAKFTSGHLLWHIMKEVLPELIGRVSYITIYVCYFCFR